MNSHPIPDGNNMGGSNQFPNMGGPMPGYTQFGQNTSTGQPGNSPGFQDGSNAFFGQMPFPGMYQPQMPLPQEKTELSNEQYQQYMSKCLISVMLNKVKHVQEQMKMQMFMQQFKQNIQNNPNQNQPEGFPGTQSQMNTEVNEKNDTSTSKSPKKKKKVSQKKSNKKSSNHGKLVSKKFANHLLRLYAFVTQSLKKIKTMKVREKSKKEKKLKEKKPKAKKTKMMSQRLL